MQYSNLENVSSNKKRLRHAKKERATLDAAICNIGVAIRLTRAEAIVASSRYWYILADAFTVTCICILILLGLGTCTAWLVRDYNVKYHISNIACIHPTCIKITYNEVIVF